MSYTRILSAILILAAFSLAQGIGPEQVDYNKVKVNPAEMQSELNTRADLLQALKTGNTTKVDSALLVLSYEKVPESAIDSLEILQVNLIRGRYDLAVPQLANILMKKDKKVRYSFANDSLFHYLRNETRFAAHYTDGPVDVEQRARHLKVIEYMTEAAQANIKQEYKDLASILADLLPYYEFSDKGQWIYCSTVFKGISTDSLANIVAVRTEDWVNYHQEMDTIGVLSLFEKMRAFYKKYPESEYSDWIYQKITSLNKHVEGYKRYRNYYLDKLYTGGLGLEAFIGSSAALVVGIPLQYSRFILTPSYIYDNNSYRTKDGSRIEANNLDNFFVTAGFDAFENKWFKIQPFIGGYEFFTTGLQADFRFWMSKTLGSEFHDGTYLSLKFRYMGIYYTSEKTTENAIAEDDRTKEKKWGNWFFVGIGVHFW